MASWYRNSIYFDCSIREFMFADGDAGGYLLDNAPGAINFAKPLQIHVYFFICHEIGLMIMTLDSHYLDASKTDPISDKFMYCPIDLPEFCRLVAFGHSVPGVEAFSNSDIAQRLRY